jgi:uncharacterized membrane protein (DUF2068 family)
MDCPGLADTNVPPPDKVAPPKRRGAPTFYAIIVMKLLKGGLLLLLAFGVYRLAGHDLQHEFDALLRAINLDPERKFFTKTGRWLEGLSAGNVRMVATGTLLYSLFSLVEGTGLLFRVSWAGWLAIGESAFFIPIEIYELQRHFSAAVAVVLALNIAIVIYLYKNKGRLFKH